MSRVAIDVYGEEGVQEVWPLHEKGYVVWWQLLSSQFRQMGEET